MRVACSRNENLNCLLNYWEDLQGILNHDDSKHRWVFRSLGTITEVEISNGCPLFHIEEYKD